LKIWPRCIPCIINARVNEILRSNIDDNEKIQAIIELLRFIIKEAKPGTSTIYLASEGFRLVKKLTRNIDPYREYKKRSNELAYELLPDVIKYLERLSGYEKFRALALITVNANSLDPGVPPFTHEIEELRKTLLQGDFVIDETKKVYSMLDDIDKVAFLLDNAGEAVFDKLLVEELVRYGIEVIVIAKSGTYQNDVTYEEAIELGFNEIAHVVGTGSDYGGPLPDALSEEAKRVLNSVDLIVAKGMANYESFLYSPPPRPVFHLFKAKCVPVASTLNVEKGANIAILRNL